MSKVKSLDDVHDALVRGEDVTIKGVGKIKVIEKAARKARNPATGEEIDVPAKKALKITMYPSFKATLNGDAKI